MNQFSNTKLLYRQDQLPVFQNRMYDTRAQAKACPKGDMVLVENQDTGFIYNQAFDSSLMDYDENYQNEQAVSPLFREHLESVSTIINKTMDGDSLLEVGCGKGIFLELLQEQGYDINGFDPTYEGSNPCVKKQYFDSGANIRADGLILRHVLEHIDDPYSFLRGLKDANGGSGKIYIEVPCFDWICDQNAWFDIFYEHVNYFRLSDFNRMFETVIHSERTFGGQYLSVVADLATLRKPTFDPNDRISFPANFTQALTQKSDLQQNQTVVWGGASKGVIFALLKERAGHAIDVVIDINPAKQNKYLPATGLMVTPPKNALKKVPQGSTIFVMNSNYIDEIKQMSEYRFTYVSVDGA